MKNLPRGIILIACFLASGSVLATPINEIVVFGDSLSDSGNLFLASRADSALLPDPPPPYSNGRQSNGSIWVEKLAERLTVANPDPSLAGGNNYAYAGATTGTGLRPRSSLVYRDLDGDPGTNDPQIQVVPRIATQIDNYLANTGTFRDDQLVVLWAGANDLLEIMLEVGAGALNPADPTAVSARVDQVINVNMKTHLEQLEDSGAIRIMVPNQVDASHAPIWSNPASPLASPEAEALMHQLVLLFNARLDAMIADSGFSADIIEVDMFTAFEDLLSDPAAIGLVNTTDPAISSGLSPDGFLFWDVIHPTTVVHSLIAEAAARAIPEPSSLVLIGLGLMGLRRNIHMTSTINQKSDEVARRDLLQAALKSVSA